ncbi:MAG: deoxyribonuclease V [Nitrospinae bacterium]|nr:deoxyribonuclease V [Nitrospinota bacterium]
MNIHDTINSIESITPKEAIILQNELRGSVIARDDFGDIKLIGGVDVGVKEGIAVAAVVMFEYPSLTLVETATATRKAVFPYVPGLLAFREIPVILDALVKLSRRPDIIIVDGHGYSHPRRFGLACHLGVTLDIPAIACGKSRLVGEYREPSLGRGSVEDLVEGGEVIGKILRTRDNVKPVFISVGHRVSLDTAVRIALESARGKRLPEPVGMAHKAASNRTKDGFRKR